MWEAIDLFWLCHTATTSGTIRTGYPISGGVLEQDAWTMKVFEQIGRAYQGFVTTMRNEQHHAESLAASHAAAVQGGMR